MQNAIALATVGTLLMHKPVLGSTRDVSCSQASDPCRRRHKGCMVAHTRLVDNQVQA